MYLVNFGHWSNDRFSFVVYILWFFVLIPQVDSSSVVFFLAFFLEFLFFFYLWDVLIMGKLGWKKEGGLKKIIRKLLKRDVMYRE